MSQQAPPPYAKEDQGGKTATTPPPIPDTFMTPPQNEIPQPLPNQPGPQVIYQQPPVTVLGNTHIVIGSQLISKEPFATRCPNCRRDIVTYTDSKLTDVACMRIAVLCLLGGLLCFWIPLVMDSSYEVTHYCPECNVVVGKAL